MSYWDESETPAVEPYKAPLTREQVADALLLTRLIESLPEPLADPSRAVCGSVGKPQDWYPEPGDPDYEEKVATAIEACGFCPLRDECLQKALAAEHSYGIWGGVNLEGRTYVQERPCKRGHYALVRSQDGRTRCRVCHNEAKLANKRKKKAEAKALVAA